MSEEDPTQAFTAPHARERRTGAFVNQPVKRKFSVNEISKDGSNGKATSKLSLKKCIIVEYKDSVQEIIERTIIKGRRVLHGNIDLEEKCLENDRSSLKKYAKLGIKSRFGKIREAANWEKFNRFRENIRLQRAAIQGQSQVRKANSRWIGSTMLGIRKNGTKSPRVPKRLNDDIEVTNIDLEEVCNENDGKSLKKYARLEFKRRFEKKNEGNWEKLNKFRIQRNLGRLRSSAMQIDSQEKDTLIRLEESTVLGTRNNETKTGRPVKLLHRGRPGIPKRLLQKKRNMKPKTFLKKKMPGLPKKVSKKNSPRMSPIFRIGEKTRGHKISTISKRRKHVGNTSSKSRRRRPKVSTISKTEKHNGEAKSVKRLGRPKMIKLIGIGRLEICFNKFKSESLDNYITRVMYKNLPSKVPFAIPFVSEIPVLEKNKCLGLQTNAKKVKISQDCAWKETLTSTIDFLLNDCSAKETQIKEKITNVRSELQDHCCHPSNKMNNGKIEILVSCKQAIEKTQAKRVRDDLHSVGEYKNQLPDKEPQDYENTGSHKNSCIEEKGDDTKLIGCENLFDFNQNKTGKKDGIEMQQEVKKGQLDEIDGDPQKEYRQNDHEMRQNLPLESLLSYENHNKRLLNLPSTQVVSHLTVPAKENHATEHNRSLADDVEWKCKEEEHSTSSLRQEESPKKDGIEMQQEVKKGQLDEIDGDPQKEYRQNDHEMRQNLPLESLLSYENHNKRLLNLPSTQVVSHLTVPAKENHATEHNRSLADDVEWKCKEEEHSTSSLRQEESPKKDGIEMQQEVKKGQLDEIDGDPNIEYPQNDHEMRQILPLESLLSYENHNRRLQYMPSTQVVSHLTVPAKENHATEHNRSLADDVEWKCKEEEHSTSSLRQEESPKKDGIEMQQEVKKGQLDEIDGDPNIEYPQNDHEMRQILPLESLLSYENHNRRLQYLPSTQVVSHLTVPAKENHATEHNRSLADDVEWKCKEEEHSTSSLRQEESPKKDGIEMQEVKKGQLDEIDGNPNIEYPQNDHEMRQILPLESLLSYENHNKRLLNLPSTQVVSHLTVPAKENHATEHNRSLADDVEWKCKEEEHSTSSLRHEESPKKDGIEMQQEVKKEQLDEIDGDPNIEYPQNDHEMRQILPLESLLSYENHNRRLQYLPSTQVVSHLTVPAKENYATEHNRSLADDVEWKCKDEEHSTSSLRQEESPKKDGIEMQEVKKGQLDEIDGNPNIEYPQNDHEMRQILPLESLLSYENHNKRLLNLPSTQVVSHLTVPAKENHATEHNRSLADDVEWKCKEEEHSTSSLRQEESPKKDGIEMQQEVKKGQLDEIDGDPNIEYPQNDHEMRQILPLESLLSYENHNRRLQYLPSTQVVSHLTVPAKENHATEHNRSLADDVEWKCKEEEHSTSSLRQEESPKKDGIEMQEVKKGQLDEIDGNPNIEYPQNDHEMRQILPLESLLSYENHNKRLLNLPSTQVVSHLTVPAKENHATEHNQSLADDVEWKCKDEEHSTSSLRQEESPKKDGIEMQQEVKKGQLDEIDGDPNIEYPQNDHEMRQILPLESLLSYENHNRRLQYLPSTQVVSHLTVPAKENHATEHNRSLADDVEWKCKDEEHSTSSLRQEESPKKDGIEMQEVKKGQLDEIDGNPNIEYPQNDHEMRQILPLESLLSYENHNKRLLNLPSTQVVSHLTVPAKENHATEHNRSLADDVEWKCREEEHSTSSLRQEESPKKDGIEMQQEVKKGQLDEIDGDPNIEYPQNDHEMRQILPLESLLSYENHNRRLQYLPSTQVVFHLTVPAKKNHATEHNRSLADDVEWKCKEEEHSTSSLRQEESPKKDGIEMQQEVKKRQLDEIDGDPNIEYPQNDHEMRQILPLESLLSYENHNKRLQYLPSTQVVSHLTVPAKENHATEHNRSLADDVEWKCREEEHYASSLRQEESPKKDGIEMQQEVKKGQLDEIDGDPPKEYRQNDHEMRQILPLESLLSYENHNKRLQYLPSTQVVSHLTVPAKKNHATKGYRSHEGDLAWTCKEETHLASSLRQEENPKMDGIELQHELKKVQLDKVEVNPSIQYIQNAHMIKQILPQENLVNYENHNKRLLNLPSTKVVSHLTVPAKKNQATKRNRTFENKLEWKCKEEEYSSGSVRKEKRHKKDGIEMQQEGKKGQLDEIDDDSTIQYRQNDHESRQILSLENLESYKNHNKRLLNLPSTQVVSAKKNQATVQNRYREDDVEWKFKEEHSPSSVRQEKRPEQFSNETQIKVGKRQKVEAFAPFPQPSSVGSIKIENKNISLAPRNKEILHSNECISSIICAEEMQPVQKKEVIDNNEDSDEDLRIKLIPVVKYPGVVGSYHSTMAEVREWAKKLQAERNQHYKKPEPQNPESNLSKVISTTGINATKCSEARSFFDLSDDNSDNEEDRSCFVPREEDGNKEEPLSNLPSTSEETARGGKCAVGLHSKYFSQKCSEAQSFFDLSDDNSDNEEDRSCFVPREEDGNKEEPLSNLPSTSEETDREGKCAVGLHSKYFSKKCSEARSFFEQELHNEDDRSCFVPREEDGNKEEPLNNLPSTSKEMAQEKKCAVGLHSKYFSKKCSEAQSFFDLSDDNSDNEEDRSGFVPREEDGNKEEPLNNLPSTSEETDREGKCAVGLHSKYFSQKCSEARSFFEHEFNNEEDRSCFVPREEDANKEEPLNNLPSTSKEMAQEKKCAVGLHSKYFSKMFANATCRFYESEDDSDDDEDGCVIDCSEDNSNDEDDNFRNFPSTCKETNLGEKNTVGSCSKYFSKRCAKAQSFFDSSDDDWSDVEDGNFSDLSEDDEDNFTNLLATSKKLTLGEKYGIRSLMQSLCEELKGSMYRGKIGDIWY